MVTKTKRYFVMLAHVFNERKHQAAGAMISEKLEGMRAFWDGGISRGMLKSEVPWANHDKDERYLSAPRATGLWSRLGNVIHAPDTWLDKLPKIPLDGELFIERGEFQLLVSIVKDLEPGPGWGSVKFFCFDMPPPDVIFANGPVEFRHKQASYFHNILNWKPVREFAYTYRPRAGLPFRSVYFLLQKYLKDNPIAKAHVQQALPYGAEGLEVALGMAEEISRQGGEGCIIRQPDSVWAPERSHNILKIKKYKDAEGIVVGYTTGRQTDRGSKLLGKMGALILNFKGKRLEISGFTDDERELGWTNGPDKSAPCDPESWAVMNPDKEVPDWIQAKHFPRGSEVTFTYRALTKDGIPSEAHYHRKRERV